MRIKNRDEELSELHRKLDEVFAKNDKVLILGISNKFNDKIWRASKVLGLPLPKVAVNAIYKYVTEIEEDVLAEANSERRFREN